MNYYKLTFYYRGKTNTITIKSKSKLEAITEAKKISQGILVKIEILHSSKIKFKEELFKNFKEKVFQKKVHKQNYISALKQLAVLLKAGISIKEALEEVANNNSDKLIRYIFLNTVENINKGMSLTQSFEKFSYQLGAVSIALIKLGEETGDLAKAIMKLIEIEEKIYENKKRLLKSLRYPIITFIAVIIAFFILLSSVLPKFQTIFMQLHTSLPLPTQILLNIDIFLKNYSFIFFIGIISLIGIILLTYKFNKKFKYLVDKLSLKIFLIGKILEYSNLYKIFLLMFSLIKAGVPLLKALNITKEATKNNFLKKKLSFIILRIKQGKSLYEAIKEEQLCNFIALKMIEAGENSGELDTMMYHTYKYYKENLDEIIENINSYIEPLSLGLIGLFILLLALGIFMPMWNISNGLKYVG